MASNSRGHAKATHTNTHALSEVDPELTRSNIRAQFVCPTSADMRLTASTPVLRTFATEMACPRRVRLFPNSGLNDETRTRPVEDGWRFAASAPPAISQNPREQTPGQARDRRRCVSRSSATSYPPETPQKPREQTCMNVHDR